MGDGMELFCVLFVVGYFHSIVVNANSYFCNRYSTVSAKVISYFGFWLLLLLAGKLASYKYSGQSID